MRHLVSGPNDILVYGRGSLGPMRKGGRCFFGGHLLAAARWSHFIRVHGSEFVEGAWANGVSLNELMDELGPYAFGPTAENADRGIGNVDPRKSIRQAAAIRLSEAGASWLGEELEGRFREFGKLPGHKLDFD